MPRAVHPVLAIRPAASAARTSALILRAPTVTDGRASRVCGSFVAMLRLTNHFPPPAPPLMQVPPLLDISLYSNRTSLFKYSSVYAHGFIDMIQALTLASPAYSVHLTSSPPPPPPPTPHSRLAPTFCVICVAHAPLRPVSSAPAADNSLLPLTSTSSGDAPPPLTYAPATRANLVVLLNTAPCRVWVGREADELLSIWEEEFRRRPFRIGTWGGGSWEVRWWRRRWRAKGGKMGGVRTHKAYYACVWRGLLAGTLRGWDDAGGRRQGGWKSLDDEEAAIARDRRMGIPLQFDSDTFLPSQTNTYTYRCWCSVTSWRDCAPTFILESIMSGISFALLATLSLAYFPPP
ncbi:hypothetical protein R3P38DRAFT_3379687 [Favolaschia claudopus]|uniref:Uncharacterized protein n=1 Tax=Favolaschia claudopus TaxID=2862362 RepID=A0AAV9Z4K3_9AGAR